MPEEHVVWTRVGSLCGLWSQGEFQLDVQESLGDSQTSLEGIRSAILSASQPGRLSLRGTVGESAFAADAETESVLRQARERRRSVFHILHVFYAPAKRRFLLTIRETPSEETAFQPESDDADRISALLRETEWLEGERLELLRRVEGLEAELAQAKSERDKLLQQIAARDAEIERLEKENAAPIQRSGTAKPSPVAAPSTIPPSVIRKYVADSKEAGIWQDQFVQAYNTALRQPPWRPHFLRTYGAVRLGIKNATDRSRDNSIPPEFVAASGGELLAIPLPGGGDASYAVAPGFETGRIDYFAYSVSGFKELFNLAGGGTWRINGVLRPALLDARYRILEPGRLDTDPKS